MQRLVERIQSVLDDGHVELHRQWLPPHEAEACLRAVRDEVNWVRERLVLYGRRIPVPRTVAWYGDPDCRYRYSGVDHEPQDWTPALADLRRRLASAGLDFNAVLANRYADGREHMGWHSDDEPELGSRPLLASLSLGATRRMRFRHRRRVYPPLSLDLDGGDLLLMAGDTQVNWQHCLARTARPVGERINLTFRRVVVA